ncbi:MAG TPA: PAS domain-containing protein [Blastocatellia bacterium]|nr:PAS domain-containing protein [Blastocatellia bacterium]
MKTQPQNGAGDAHAGNGGRPASDESQAISLPEAEAILTELASVFFPVDSPIQASADDAIGKRKRATIPAAELPNAIARYRTLVEQIPAVVFMAFLDKGIGEAYVSPQIEAMLGFSQEEWLNDPVRWYQHIHPDDKMRWSVEAAQMFLTGEPLRSVYRVTARDGRVVWFHCEAKMVRRDDGRPWFIHGVGFDITELKQAEEALKEAHDKLEVRVRQRTAELESANRELQLEISERQAVESELLKARDELERRVEQRTVALARANEILLKEIGERRRAEDALRDYAERLKILSRRLMEVQEAERRNMARELHDEIGQVLTGLKLSLEMCARLPADRIGASLAQPQMLVNELMAHARKLSLDLRPGMLDDLGLLPTLLWHIEHYTAQTRVRVMFKHSGIEGRRFAPAVETAAYRIAQEALTNIARHAGVDQAALRVWADHHTLNLQIEDQGSGFDSDAAVAARDTSGLAGMRERAMLLGGQLTIESRAGSGTSLTAELKVGDELDPPSGARGLPASQEDQR